jgi:hypothetical protein
MVIISALGFALTSALAAIYVAASPTSPTVIRRDNCTPSFSGRRQSVYRVAGRGYGYQWIPTVATGGSITMTGEPMGTLVTTGEFRVPFTGQPNGSFQFRSFHLDVIQ